MSQATPIRVALIGLGKIARDQHLPAMAADPRFDLVAVVSRHATQEGLPNFHTLDDLLASGLAFDAVALCTPPQVRHGLARQALEAGKHVMLEKPPGATLSEVEDLRQVAEAQGVTLQTTWHSRHAPAVAPARDWLAGKTLTAARIIWKEDVRVWHPGQAWIWEPGGLGVFDPGINALSIVTRIMPEKFHLTRSDLTFPANRAAPIAASLTFETASGLPIAAEFDWRQTGPQTWDIRVETEEGSVVLTHGGSRLIVDGEAQIVEEDREYRNLYRDFVSLVNEGASDTDFSPLMHVADAFLLGRRIETEAFED